MCRESSQASNGIVGGSALRKREDIEAMGGKTEKEPHEHQWGTKLLSSPRML